MRIEQGDCLELMKSIPDGSVDLVVTSPPYDNLRTYNGNICQWNEQKWKDIIVQLYRITNQGGVVVWVVGDATIKGSETGTCFKQALWAKECGFNLHDTMIWRKPNPMPHIKKDIYTPSFEYMFVFSKGRPNVCNRITEHCKYAGVLLKTYTTNPESIRRPNTSRVTKENKIKSNVWDFVVAGTNYGHPAIYPLQLAKDHIISWSNENDLVFDPFMGSGTTGVACKNLNRDFMGFELDKGYFEIAKKRIEETI